MRIALLGSLRPHCLLALLSCVTLCSSSAVAGPGCRSVAWETRRPHYRAEFAGREFRYYSKDAREPDLVYTLETVRLDGKEMARGAVPGVTVGAEGARCRYNALVTETYTPLAEGVEQSWVIARRPSEAGDIVIRGRIRSPHRARLSVGGWRFVDRLGRDVLSYGIVTVIDSRGRTYSCLPRIDGSRLTITVPRSFVSSASFPITVDPVVGSEVPICPVFGPAPNSQESVEVSASPYGYLAVWQDGRGANGVDIFACRVSLTGQVLDLSGIAVSTAPGDQTDPAVTWDGQNYLVVWADRRAAAQHIYAARVRPTGEVLDRQGVLVSGTSGVQAYPKVAGNGSGALVVWQDARGSSADVYGCKISGDGVVGRVYGIATRMDNEESPDVAWNGSKFIVVWCDYRNISTSNTDIYGCRVSTTGIRMVGDTLISSSSSGSAGASDVQRNPRICSYGSSCAIVWEDFRNDTARSDIYGCRLNSSNVVLDRGGILVSGGSDGQDLPGIGFDGNNLLVTWRERASRLVRGARVDTNGIVLDRNGIAISSGSAGSGGTAAAGYGGNFLAVWNSLNVMASDAMGTVVTGGGVVKTPAGTVLSLGLDNQQDYAVADNGSEYAIVWSQVVDGSHDILAARVSRSGTLITPTPVNLTRAYPGNQTQPSIAWNGARYLVVWRGDESYAATGWDVWGLLLDNALSKVSPSPIGVCNVGQEQARPCAVSNRDNFLVVWEDARNAVSPYYYTDLYGAVVSSGGSVTPMTSALSVAYGDQRRPKCTTNGSDYFVVWEDYRSGYPAVFGARVTSGGINQNTSGIAMPSTSYYQTGPDVCFGNGSYFIAWSDMYSIYGCRVSTAGAVIDAAGIQIDSGSRTRAYPAACWDGSRYQVVWEDYRSSYEGNSDIYYTTIDANGIVSPDPKMALVSDLTPQLRPRIFGYGSSGALLYSRYYNYSNCVVLARLTEQGVQKVDKIATAKGLPFGTLVSLSGKVVTAAFPECFYIEELNRTSGIKVVSSVPVRVDDVVDVTGTIGLADGERQISSGIVSTLGIAPVAPGPIGIRGDCLGGGSLNRYTPGITGAIGTNNLGLLVTTWGKVTSNGAGYFYITSRPGNAIRVNCASLLQPAVGKTVSVTGISTCEVLSGATGRAIRVREQGDIQVHK